MCVDEHGENKPLGDSKIRSVLLHECLMTSAGIKSSMATFCCDIVLVHVWHYDNQTW